MGFKYSVSNWIYGEETLDVTLERLSRYGYDGIELMGEPGRYKVEEVYALCKKFGLKVLSIAGMYPWPTDERDLSNPSETVRSRAVQYLKDCCDFAARLEAGVIIVVPSAVGKTLPVGEPRSEEQWLEAYEKEWKLAVEAVGEAALYAERKGVVLAIEPINRYETFLVNTCEQGLKMIKEIGSPAVKLHLDVFHMNIEEKDIPEAIRTASGMLVNLHVADSNRTAVGEGHVDFRAVIDALLDIGYEGMLTLEPLPPVPDPYMAARMKRFMHLWEDYARVSIERLKGIEDELRSRRK